MNDNYEEDDLRYYKEIEAEAEVEQNLLYFRELSKKDEHKFEEGVCPTCGQPFSKHGDDEIQAPQEGVNRSNPSALPHS